MLRNMRTFFLLFCCLHCKCYAETNVAAKEETSMQTMIDDDIEEMKQELKDLRNEIKILKLEKQNRDAIEILNNKFQHFEEKILETNTEFIKIMKEQRSIYEENSKCNLFLSNCMAQNSKQTENKSNENSQLTVAAMEKLLKEYQVRNWMTDGKLSDYIDLNEALLNLPLFSATATATDVLIALGANVDAQDENGDTPLIKAVERKQTDNIKVLLKNKANINLQNKKGWNALMRVANFSNPYQYYDVNNFDAENKRNLKILEILLKNNANVDLFNNDQETAYMLAMKNGNINMANRLLKKI